MTGEDSWLLEDLVRRLKKIVLAPGAEMVDLMTIDCEGKSQKLPLEQLFFDRDTPPFISSKRLIIIRRSGSFVVGGLDEKRRDRFIELLSNIPDSTCMVFIEDKVDRRLSKLIKAVEKIGVYGQILHEQPPVLGRWIRHSLEQYKILIEPSAIENLIDRCDSDMRQIQQELKKIRHYCEGAGHTRVDLDLLDEICIPDTRGTIFNITDAISVGNTDRALELLHVLLGRREPVQVILFMLARHFKQLIYALEARSEQQLTSAIGVQPFVARRLMRQCRRFSLHDLEKLYATCFETDLAIKTSLIQERDALEIILVQAGQAAQSR